MTALSTREALARHFHSGRDDIECSHTPFTRPCVDEADALIASGVVVDATTLADDEALVERVALGTLGPSAQMDDYTRDGQDLILRRTRHALRALATALTERGQA